MGESERLVEKLQLRCTTPLDRNYLAIQATINGLLHKLVRGVGEVRPDTVAWAGEPLIPLRAQEGRPRHPTVPPPVEVLYMVGHSAEEEFYLVDPPEGTSTPTGEVLALGENIRPGPTGGGQSGPSRGGGLRKLGGVGRSSGVPPPVPPSGE